MSTLSVPKKRPGVWNRLVINGKAWPGIVQRVRLGGRLLMDQHPITGKDGVVIGNAQWSEDTAEFEITILEAEFGEVSRIRDGYKNRPGIRPSPVSVSHPMLEILNVRQTIIEEVEFNWAVNMKNRLSYRVRLTNITPKAEKQQTGGVQPKTSVTTSTDVNGKTVTRTTVTTRSGNTTRKTTTATASTSAPKPIKPNLPGIPESNEITGQPTPTKPSKPKAPGPGR